jgi:hypothetical protein
LAADAAASMTAGSLLFAYGTLQDPAVQTAVFGHDLGPGAPDRLSGYHHDAGTLGGIAKVQPAECGN